jgi:hypothetical protein
METFLLFKNKAKLIDSLIFITTLAFITALSSCNKEDIKDNSIPDAIDEYQAFYKEQMLNSEIKGNSTIPRRSPKWEKATIKKWYRGYAAVAPLDYEENYFISSSTSPYSFTLGAISFLMINKGRDGSMQGEIVYIIRDNLANLSDKGGQPRFCGTILVESLHGEFLATYVCKPDGSVLRYSNSIAATSPKTADSKGIDCYIYELWQKTSIDGGETWSEPILISSHMECSFSPDYNIDTAYDYYDLGGGGGETNDGGGGYTLQSSRPLTATETQNLGLVRNELTKDCATNKVINAVWSGLIFNVDGSISTPAQYDPNTNTITFRGSSDINANAIIEEVFHAYQNTLYPGGIAQYSRYKPGNTNIEFEAKLFKDICTSLYGGVWSISIGFPNAYMLEYEMWVNSVADNGFTPTLMQKYNTMLGYFNRYNAYYGGYLLPGLDIPLAIIQSKSGCN